MFILKSLNPYITAAQNQYNSYSNSHLLNTYTVIFYNGTNRVKVIWRLGIYLFEIDINIRYDTTTLSNLLLYYTVLNSHLMRKLHACNICLFSLCRSGWIVDNIKMSIITSYWFTFTISSRRQYQQLFDCLNS